MDKIVFSPSALPTLGIELELGLVDADTMELSSSVQQLLERVPEEFRDSVKPELMQCYVEINTGICNTVADARRDLEAKVRAVQSVAENLGLHLWWGGTHPFSLWRSQQITPNPRYEALVELLQEMARRLVSYGLHIHVGVESGDKAVMICDRIMQHLPTLLALSCSSPFWDNRDTGLESYRSKLMEGLPTAGLPTLMRNWSEYVWLINHLIETKFITTIREVWWDVRPHHNFGTVEVRVCDMPGNLDDCLAIAGLVQSLVKALSDQIDAGTYQHDCHPMIVRQNKWRACRFGNRAQLVDSFSFQSRPVAAVAERLSDLLGDVATSLGCRDELEECRQLASRPGWGQQQRAILAETGDPTEIVRRLVAKSRLA